MPDPEEEEKDPTRTADVSRHIEAGMKLAKASSSGGGNGGLTAKNVSIAGSIAVGVATLIIGLNTTSNSRADDIRETENARTDAAQTQTIEAYQDRITSLEAQIVRQEEHEAELITRGSGLCDTRVEDIKESRSVVRGYLEECLEVIGDR